MALQPYRRVSFLWGAIDAESGAPPYHGDEVVSLGSDARSGSGVGVRRSSLVFSRISPTTFGEDVAVMHFDWLNFTSGNPDDTWTESDFTSVEANLGIWFDLIASSISSLYTFKEVRWYRIGTGVTPPNPPVRVKPIAKPGTAGGKLLPPQCASSISLHTAPRRNWGRTYLPGLVGEDTETNGTLTAAFVNALQGATVQLYGNLALGDIAMVVMSKTRAAALSVEAIAVDDIVDIIRSRRWEHPQLRVVTPTPAGAMAKPAPGKGLKGAPDASDDELDEENSRS